MKEIRLHSGQVTVVDDDVYVWASQMRWYLIKGPRDRHGYAATSRVIGDKQEIRLLHRIILNTPDGFETDHINGNSLDNRRENLRVASKSENRANSALRRCKTSRFRGVCWHRQRAKWTAAIRVNCRSIYLGLFVDETDAALAYNEAAKKHFGEFARLNELS